jgi:hypothetical protein
MHTNASRNRSYWAPKASQLLCTCLFALALAACGDKTEPAATEATEPAAPGEPSAPALKAGPGVDVATKTVRLGVLNDESGPAATIGKPYAIAKRILAAQINAGGSGLLPDGWKVELVEKDHGYNPQKSVQAYNQIKDDVLFIATSFGTPNTLPLRSMLERDKMVALPASLSSQMAQNRFTIPGGTSYELEAMRAMDWVVEEAEKAGLAKDKIKPAIVYQQDDYGQDGLNGWKKAAATHGLTMHPRDPACQLELRLQAGYVHHQQEIDVRRPRRQPLRPGDGPGRQHRCDAADPAEGGSGSVRCSHVGGAERGATEPGLSEAPHQRGQLCPGGGERHGGRCHSTLPPGV